MLLFDCEYVSARQRLLLNNVYLTHFIYHLYYWLCAVRTIHYGRVVTSITWNVTVVRECYNKNTHIQHILSGLFTFAHRQNQWPTLGGWKAFSNPHRTCLIPSNNNRTDDSTHQLNTHTYIFIRKTQRNKTKVEEKTSKTRILVHVFRYYLFL